MIKSAIKGANSIPCNLVGIVFLIGLYKFIVIDLTMKKNFSIFFPNNGYIKKDNMTSTIINI